MTRRQLLASASFLLAAAVSIPAGAIDTRGPDLRLKQVVLEGGMLDLHVANFERRDVHIEWIRTDGPEAAWKELKALLPAGKVTVISVAVEGEPAQIELRTPSQVVRLER
jgi:hypothetical protein